eukprot:SAG11_NODE_37948_length_254_cov_1.161290_1_plen_30_part_01
MTDQSIGSMWGTSGPRFDLSKYLVRFGPRL